MNARTRFGLLLGGALVALTFTLACGGEDEGMSEDECAAYAYQSFARESAETGGDCGDMPDGALAAFEPNGAKCQGGYKTDVCEYRFSWDCPGEDGQTITYEGIVTWRANERTGYGGSAVTIKDKDGNQVCQSTYDEAWAGDEPAPASD